MWSGAEEKKEGGSPRFRKLHFPVGLWINSPRKHIAKLSKRWPSAGSVRSTTSSDAVSLGDAPPLHPASSSSQPLPFPLSQALPPSSLALSLSLSTPSLAHPSPSPSPSFLRPRPAPSLPQSRAKRLSHLFLRGRSNSDREREREGEGEREREREREREKPPGLIKIYGDALSSGANYRSVLATAHSSAQQLIAHVITRYTEREREGEGEEAAEGEEGQTAGGRRKPHPEDFVLCDVIGRPLPRPGGGVEWEAECRRGVAAWERPLILIDMWRPKEGFERRFEIQRREEYEKEEREREKEREREREREGENYTGVRFRRSRIASGGGAEGGGRGRMERGADLRRSISDMNLSLRRRQGNQGHGAQGSSSQDQRKNIMSMIETEQGELLGSKVSSQEVVRPQDEEEVTTSDLERMSQSLILPPTDCPYFLLLQGYDQTKDFILYIMSGHTHIFGRRLTARERERDRERDGEREARGKHRKPLKVDTFLSAPDLLPRHLLVRRDSALPEHAYSGTDSTRSQCSPALIRPFRSGAVTLNGAGLYREAELKPGDLLGLGRHFLFLYRDPRVVPAPPLSLPLPWHRAQATPRPASAPGLGSAPCCPGALIDRQYLSSSEASLRFLSKHIDPLLQEIIGKNSSPDSGGGSLAPAYLLSIMIDHVSKHLEPTLLPQLLLKTANHVKSIVWDKIKEFGEKHPSENSSETIALRTPTVKEVTSDLRPLMFWMSNATELLNLFQVKVEEMEREWEFEAPGDPTLSADLDTCTEALALLDEVIMYTFQQCVYHLTKTLYSLLPALLDTNPFSLLPQGQKKKTKKKKKRERVTEKEGEKEESKSEEVERSGEGEERVEEEQEEGEGEGEEKEEEEGEGGEEEGDETSLPPTVARLVDVYRQSLALCQEAQLSPPLTSQTFGYLFFFTNTSLLNTLLERGCRPEGMFSWSRAVQIRTNLDLVLDWLQGAGLGDIASEFLRKLSITVNFLCIPKTRLIQSSWSSLLEDHPLLSPAQLNHLLKHYRLGPARATPTAWTPPPGTDLSTDIFESFLDHPPLILPNETPRLDLSEPIPSPELQKEVTRIRSFIWGLDQDELPANQRTRL